MVTIRKLMRSKNRQELADCRRSEAMRFPHQRPEGPPSRGQISPIVCVFAGRLLESCTSPSPKSSLDPIPSTRISDPDVKDNSPARRAAPEDSVHGIIIPASTCRDSKTPERRLVPRRGAPGLSANTKDFSCQSIMPAIDITT